MRVLSNTTRLQAKKQKDPKINAFSSGKSVSDFSHETKLFKTNEGVA